MLRRARKLEILERIRTPTRTRTDVLDDPVETAATSGPAHRTINRDSP
jgi:hypothetical protein